LISGVPTAIIGALAAAFVRDIVTLQLINGAAGAVANVLVVPFGLIAYTLMYYDLRIRKEGFDLEQQARNLMPDYGSTSYGPPINQ
jgi:hypothetical protein